jgi:periplasmic mercuric ion binding protein
MKMKTIVVSTVIALFTNFAFAGEQIKVGVKGMVCAFCAQGIEKKFNAESEVEKVDVSLENKFVNLTFKDGKRLSNDKIAEILKDAGYEAVFEPAPLESAKDPTTDKSKVIQPEKKK